MQVRQLAGMAGLLALVGCSSLTEIDQQQLADAQLMQNVLLQDATLRQVSTECMRLYPETMALAYETHAQWWQYNNRWVIQADQGLNKQVLDSVERHQSAKGTTLGLSVSLKVSQQAGLNRDELLTKNPGAAGCRTLLQAYQQGDYDLDRDSKLKLSRLAVLAAEYFPPRQLDASVLLQSHDRSQFVAERLAQRALCPQAQLSALVRQWPREVYNVDCGRERQYLIRCRWSECQILP
jgi:hypothetical protein